MEKELRYIDSQVTLQDDSRNVEGYAIRFDSPSQFMGYYETISRSAVTEDLINKSDIFALFNHNEERVLARSRYGEGSLHLEIRDDGLYYSFELPNTQWGNEVEEHLKRGEIFGSSFAFTIADDGDEITKDENGVYHRTITKFERLFDVSPVFEPAYLSTTCSKRMLEIMEQDKAYDELKIEIRNVVDEDEQKEDEPEAQDEQEEQVEEQQREAQDETTDEETQSEGNEENEPEDEQNTEDSEEEDTTSAEVEKNNLEINKFSNITKMEKQFSLLRAIRSIAFNKQMDEIDAAVINEGKRQMAKSGQSFAGQIQLPAVAETREAVSVTTDGEHVVATEIYDILEPLRAKNVLTQAGATFMTGLVGNVQVPIMSATNVTWEGETAPARDGAPTFSHVTLSPKRLTAYIDISKQFLVQDGIGAEAKIREDLVKAISSKLEATILGDDEGTTTVPAGMFYGVTPEEIDSYEDVVDLEADLDDANVTGQFKYVMSNKARAALRAMIKGTNATGMVYENGEVDGAPALYTSNVDGKKYIVGDWSNLAIGQWGAIDLTVDPFTQAADGMVRIVINAFFDAKVLRPEAFAFGEIDNA